MSIPVVDKHSGAIIFQPTPEEIKIQGLEKKVDTLEKRIERMEKMLRKRKRRW